MNNTMRKFNLELALQGAPVITRDGQDAYIIDAKEVNNGVVIAGWVGDGVVSWDENGTHAKNRESFLDLFLAGKEKYYVNIYKDDNGLWASEHMYETHETAVAMGEDTPYFYDTIMVEI